MIHRLSGTDVAGLWTLDHVDASAARRRTLASWILATWVGVTMVAILPAILIHATPAPKSAAWSFTLAITTIAGARYSWIVADGRRRLYEMSFWVFTYVFLGIAPLAQLRTGQLPITTPRIDTSLQQQALVVVIVGIVAVLIGASFSLPPQSFLRAKYVANGVDLGRSVVLALCALLFDAYFTAKVGIGNLLSSRDELSRAVGYAWAESSTTALVVAVTTMTLLVAFIALVKCLGQTKHREWPLMTLTVLVGLALAVTVNPIANARYISGTAILAVATLFGLFATSRRFRVTAILWVVALIVVFPLADAFRYSTSGEFKSTSVLESLTSPDFDAFAEIDNTLLYVERHGVTRGRQAVGVAMFWVPRRLWPDKPRDTGIVLSDSRGYTVQNLSAPLWTEMYINGGWPLLVVGMLGLGILLRSQDNQIEESLRRARAPGILACILPFYLTILLRGSLLQAMSYLLVILVSTMFVSRWERVSPR